MLAVSIPPRFPIPFAANAGGPYIRSIPEASQIGINAGYASLYDGFVPLNMTPLSAGGVPPYGQDMNGILKQVTQWSQWQAAGGGVTYDASFSASIGGYPAGAMLKANGSNTRYWVSIIDNNTGDPNAGAANWLSFDTNGAATTGDVKWRPTSQAIPGWVAANALTIGSAASGATGLASSEAAALYAWEWDNFSNTQCPVTGGRGANAAADFANNKPIQLLDLRGTGMMGMDTMEGGATTRLTGVPVVSGNATTPGSVLGENFHALIGNENGPHGHNINDPGHTHGVSNGVFGGQTSGLFGLNDVSAPRGGALITINSAATGISIVNSGLGTPHNTVDRVMVGTIHLKL